MDAAHRLARYEGHEQAPALGFERRPVGRIGRELAKARVPPFVVAFYPDADLVAPFVRRERRAAALEYEPVRFEFGCFAVEDDAVEIEYDGRNAAHRFIISNSVDR